MNPHSCDVIGQASSITLHCKFIKISAATVLYRDHTLAVDLESIRCIPSQSMVTLRPSNISSDMTTRTRQWSSQCVQSLAPQRSSKLLSPTLGSSRATLKASTNRATLRMGSRTALQRRSWNPHTCSAQVQEADRARSFPVLTSLSLF